ncbi:hypothetical protein L6654_03130 [Bradyrhizobium sp. WYCCWR 13023]|uniref:Uncharacterized protein n=1 Tax=Bradyrhizobium zhengyangense TaxID=2911009 RepID=A0A9X1U5I4_9BRAD|nr:hypothetical protein [Bradyrhizobium zhengyangense]MCG2625605.1 hypothetical protein [Bradyrhizobium zhengyangense]
MINVAGRRIPAKPEEEQKESEMTNLPTIDFTERLIHGSLLKCTDGRWSTQDQEDMTGKQLVALLPIKAIQRWRSNEPVETLVDTGEGLPNVADLNAAIPRSEWQPGLDGQPRPPFQLQYVVYLLDEADASIFTFANGTAGAHIAWKRLVERLSWMRALRKSIVYPLVVLDRKTMKTDWGPKLRPEFTIKDWRYLGGSGGPPLEGRPPDLIGKPVKTPSTAEELQDDIPF